MRTRGLTHIALAVRDAERSFRFYEEVLGVVAVYRQPGFIQAQTPGSWDVLVFEEKDADTGESGGIAHFGFRLVNPQDLEIAVEAVERAGGKVLSRGEFCPGEPYLFFADPDGYEAEIWYELPTPVDPEAARAQAYEEALRQSEERFAKAFAASPLVLTISSLTTGKLLEVNETFVHVTGYSREEALGRTTVELGLWAKLKDREAELEMVRQSGRVRNLEYRFRKRNGEEIVGLLSAERIEVGGDPCALTVIQDITERKRVEETLRAAQEQLQVITDTMAAAVTRCSRDQCYVWVSRGYAAWLGRPPEEFAGRPISEVLGEEAYATIRPYIERVLAGEKVEYEAQVNYKRLGRRWIHAVYIPTYESTSAPDGWVAVVNDITHRKELEEALRQADRRKDEFLATLAHELRNPLAPVRNSLEVMKLAGDNGEAVDRARCMIERQVRHMVRLIDDLLDVSRISQGKIELRKERVDLAAVVRSAVETSRPLIEQAGHDLAVSVPLEPVYVEADLTRLAQVLSNLLNNAAKYTERGGHLRLAVERQDGQVAVSVRDDGIGIPAEMLSQVFDLFTQVDQSLEKAQGGLGVGLTLVKRLTEMHGGTVEARSAGRGMGSEFIVRLPIVPFGAGEQHTGDGEGATASAVRRRVLVVDDNVDAAISLAMMFEIMGHETQTAHDGLAALDAAAAFRPDVILLDIGMPKLNGYEVCRRIRAQPWGKDVVLVALTGWGQDEDRRRSQEAGFDQHLVKPVEPAALLKLLPRVAGAKGE